MSAAILAALALLAEPDAYNDRLLQRSAVSASDPVVVEAYRVEHDLRARVGFVRSPHTFSAISIVIVGKTRRVSIVAFPSHASWVVERVEISAADGGYDRSTPIGTRSDLSSDAARILNELTRSQGWLWKADCHPAEQVVMTIHGDSFPHGDHIMKGCPLGSAKTAYDLLDADAPADAH